MSSKSALLPGLHPVDFTGTVLAWGLVVTWTFLLRAAGSGPLHAAMGARLQTQLPAWDMPWSPPCLWLHCDQQHVLMAKSHTRGAGVLLVGQGKLCVLVIKRERQSMTRNKKCSPGKCVQQEIQAAVVPGTPKF